MKKIVFILFSMILFACNSSEPKILKIEKDSIIIKNFDAEESYDSLYANKLNADEYGMKKYVLAFLKRGPTKLKVQSQIDSLQKEHLKNIMKMAKEGKLVVAGPFLDDQDIRGIYIFNVETIEEAKQLTATDPAIKAGTLMMELHPWYGSAAMQEINKIHKRIEKVNVAE